MGAQSIPTPTNEIPDISNANQSSSSAKSSNSLSIFSKVTSSTSSTVYAVDGMLDTLTSKCHAASLVPKILNLRPALKKCLQKSAIHHWLKDFFLSQQNILRSLNVYYAHDVKRKNKYLNVRRANRSRFTNFIVPNYISYPKLSSYIHSINIGNWLMGWQRKVFQMAASETVNHFC